MRQLKITKQVTNRETASLDKYLQEIGKVELISAEEEVELAQRIKQGDKIALEKLTKANLRFVVSVAKQYTDQSRTTFRRNQRFQVHLLRRVVDSSIHPTGFGRAIAYCPSPLEQDRFHQQNQQNLR